MAPQSCDVPLTIPPTGVAVPPSPPPPGAQAFDDPHIRTLSGHQFFLNGVGVFDYATVPGRITTQVSPYLPISP